jgi:hypothetical protein
MASFGCDVCRAIPAIVMNRRGARCDHFSSSRVAAIRRELSCKVILGRTFP